MSFQFYFIVYNPIESEFTAVVHTHTHRKWKWKFGKDSFPKWKRDDNWFWFCRFSFNKRDRLIKTTEWWLKIISRNQFHYHYKLLIEKTFWWGWSVISPCWDVYIVYIAVCCGLKWLERSWIGLTSECDGVEMLLLFGCSELSKAFNLDFPRVGIRKPFYYRMKGFQRLDSARHCTSKD